jgi:hypothetical protein
MASAVSPLACGAVWENRTAAAEADQFSKVYGTAESRALRSRRPGKRSRSPSVFFRLFLSMLPLEEAFGRSDFFLLLRYLCVLRVPCCVKLWGRSLKPISWDRVYGKA